VLEVKYLKLKLFLVATVKEPVLMNPMLTLINAFIKLKQENPLLRCPSQDQMRAMSSILMSQFTEEIMEQEEWLLAVALYEQDGRKATAAQIVTRQWRGRTITGVRNSKQNQHACTCKQTKRKTDNVTKQANAKQANNQPSNQPSKEATT
jgi:hypothetical protein